MAAATKTAFAAAAAALPNDKPIETYIFLGTQMNTHFFLHITKEEPYTMEIPSQIYNVLIRDKFITDPQTHVIIFSFNKTNEIIITQHANNPNKAQFGRKNLEEFFCVLMAAPRNCSYGIIYSYEKKCYETYYLESPLPIASLGSKIRFESNSITTFVTSKPIVNL